MQNDHCEMRNAGAYKPFKLRRIPEKIRGPDLHWRGRMLSYSSHGSRPEFPMRNAVLAAVLLTLQVLSTPCRAFTILSGPSIEKATNAPLSGILQLTTDTPSRISVSVMDGQSAWERQFYDFATNHSVPLFGFKPGRTNEISVTVYDRERNGVTASQPLLFITDPLPANFPNLAVLTADPAKMEPGYTLFRVAVENNSSAYVVIIDSSGEVVWYGTTPSTAEVRQLPNGDLFMPSTNSFVEMNLLGDTVRTWPVPGSLPIDLHEGLPTDHGSILFLADATAVVTNYPTSVTDSNAPLANAKVLFQTVVEIATTNAAVLSTWKPIDTLDPRRISYLVKLLRLGWDAQHANAVIEDPSDDSLIVSLRNQNAVVKLSRQTGGLRWILGPHEGWGAQWQPYLLTPTGASFAWPYGQHAPVLTPQGTLLLYDDGNYRTMPFTPPIADTNNYSRAVEYRIDEQKMEVSQVWEYGGTNTAERLFTPYEGNAEPLPKTGNVLIDFPAVSYVNGSAPSSFGPTATMARIKEVTHDAQAQVAFDLAITMYDNDSVLFKDCTVYRCHRIPDLYGHPPNPVADLTATYNNRTAHLQFSADDARSYVLEGSADLVDWVELGVPVEDPTSPGDFTFEAPSVLPTRFYRVVTK
jgi:hypothetical protein